jgi:hypothetical protein
MLGTFQNWLVYRAAQWALKRRGPADIFNTDADSNDFYYVIFNDAQHGTRFFADKLTGNGAEGVARNKVHVGEPFPASIPYRKFRDFKLELKHYYRGYEINHSSAWRFFVAQLVDYASWHRWNDIRQQKKFNTQQLVRHNRIKVLTHFLDRTISDRRYSSSSIGLITELYGNRWARHPDEENIQNYYSLIVESLKASGDLMSAEGVYVKIAPKALATLDTYAEDRARHSENTGIQRRIVILTFVLAFIAAIQAVVTAWTEIYPAAVSTQSPPKPPA